MTIIRLTQFVEDWPLQLRQALEKAANGDVLVVDDDTKKKFAESAAKSHFPGKIIKVLTRAEALNELGPEGLPDEML